MRGHGIYLPFILACLGVVKLQECKAEIFTVFPVLHPLLLCLLPYENLLPLLFKRYNIHVSVYYWAWIISTLSGN